ncbi:flagellar biosynthesis protein FlhF [Bacillus pinisoli]|uniref:flagellar biosynthesis protein FlhF n=1 Tax=Bacillus pinisoli TaxID=2901866 RepID=UPI001FF55042|nr:flagellar biosynthesis protein FlhF [Bacillus pinisoli]
MKVKKYIAPTMPEAMKKIRAELGKDAVILNSKVVHTGGLFGFFTKKNIEVIAAIDPSPFSNEPMQKEKPRPVQEPLIKKPLVNTELDQNTLKKDSSQSDLKQELDELKSLIKHMSTQQGSTSSSYPLALQKFEKILMDQEVDDVIRVEILNKLVEQWYKHDANVEDQEITKWFRHHVKQFVDQFNHGGISFNKQYINVIGPTGVGKTTTLAKIAANCVLKFEKRVAFITTDTYRIAAIEQLKTYAKILNVPIEVCYNIEDFIKAKEKFASYDLVFIDTAGRNFRNQQYVNELREVIDFSEEMETFLVLSLTSKLKDMHEIYRQFSTINIEKLIFTKKDETSQYGAMLNLMSAYDKGIAYITVGQNVPDDIVEASTMTIVKTVLGDNEE